MCLVLVLAAGQTGCLRVAQVHLEMVAENVRWKNQFEQVKCVEYAVNIP